MTSFALRIRRWFTVEVLCSVPRRKEHDALERDECAGRTAIICESSQRVERGRICGVVSGVWNQPTDRILMGETGGCRRLGDGVGGGLFPSAASYQFAIIKKGL
jgi:hypothetical protein